MFVDVLGTVGPTADRRYVYPNRTSQLRSGVILKPRFLSDPVLELLLMPSYLTSVLRTNTEPFSRAADVPADARTGTCLRQGLAVT
jgi:hypothetical protein